MQGAEVRGCPACNGWRLRPWAQKSGHALFECSDCGSITSSWTTDSERRSTYDGYYSGACFKPARGAVATALQRIVESAATFRLNGRWLDMGFGEGALLTKAERAGWECFGTELSPIALQHGRGRGWIVSDNPASDPRFTPRSFDIVSMIELLEHVDDARSILTTAHDYLRPGGRLYLTTPNARSLNRWVLGSNWSIVAPPEHVTLWTARGIRAALRLIGFSDIRIRTEGLNPVEFSARVARLGPVDGHERTNAAARLNEIASGGSVRRMLKRGINAALNLLHIGDTLKVSAIKS